MKTKQATTTRKTNEKKLNKSSDGSKPRPLSNSMPRTAFVGFMGAGKTTIAARLAEEIGVEWIDLDEFIEASENRSISQIIENLGESVFREIETEHLREAAKSAQTQTIALGGGAWMIEENRKILVENRFTSVWLDAPFELCWRRIKANKNAVRPLAVNKTAARKLFAARRDAYALADLRVEITPETLPAQIVEKIVKNLKTATRRQKTLTKPK